MTRTQTIRPTHKLMFASLLAAGTLVACGVDYDSSYDEMAMLIWPAEGVDDLVVETGVPGDVTVTAAPMQRIEGALHRACLGQTEFEASRFVERVTVDDELEDGTLTLWTTDAGAEDREAVADLDLFVPGTVDLTLDVGEGDAGVREFGAGSVVSVTADDIDMEHMSATIVAAATGDIDLDLEAAMPMQLVDMTAGGEVTITLPADSVFLFDLQTATGEVTLEGFESVTFHVEDTDRKVGAVGRGDGAKLIIGAGTLARDADIRIIAE